jgi:hypothetical protein
MRKNQLSHLALSDGGFLFDTRSGFTFTLNAVGTHVLRAFIAGRTMTEARDEIVDRFEVKDDEASRDIERFCSRLHELNLVEDA